MLEIGKRVLYEPAVFLGFILAAIAVTITILTGDPWDTDAFTTALGPLIAALGISTLRNGRAGKS